MHIKKTLKIAFLPSPPQGLWKDLRSEYGTSYAAMDQRPTEAVDDDALLRTVSGQSGFHLTVMGATLTVLEVLRDKIRQRKSGPTETRRFFTKLFGKYIYCFRT